MAEVWSTISTLLRHSWLYWVGLRFQIVNSADEMEWSLLVISWEFPSLFKTSLHTRFWSSCSCNLNSICLSIFQRINHPSDSSEAGGKEFARYQNRRQLKHLLVYEFLLPMANCLRQDKRIIYLNMQSVDCIISNDHQSYSLDRLNIVECIRNNALIFVR